MSFTFGGGTGDDITFTAAVAGVGNTSSTFVCGWFYPTTLTNGRFLWSCGNVIGSSIDATTDKTLTYSDNTTDSQNSADPNLTVNKWWFLAWLIGAGNGGPTCEVRQWVGDAENCPAEVTVTQTVAPTGNFTGSTSRTIGNRGTGTVAFQGDIGWVSFIATGGSLGITSPFGMTAGGTIAQSMATLTLNRWVIPFWLGRPDLSYASLAASDMTFSLCHAPLNQVNPVYQRSHDQAAATNPAVTTNGATYSTNYPPREPPENWPLMRPLISSAA